MDKAKRDIDVVVTTSVHLSADELAGIFWRMCNEEQAHFFNKLAEIDRFKFELQMLSVAQSKHITDSGRDVMGTIGDTITFG